MKVFLYGLIFVVAVWMFASRGMPQFGGTQAVPVALVAAPTPRVPLASGANCTGYASGGNASYAGNQINRGNGDAIVDYCLDASAAGDAAAIARGFAVWIPAGVQFRQVGGACETAVVRRDLGGNTDGLATVGLGQLYIDDEVQGNCVTWVAAHEIGHNLGLTHSSGGLMTQQNQCGDGRAPSPTDAELAAVAATWR